MITHEEHTSAHQTAIDTLAKVKEAEKQIRRVTVPIRNEHGRVVGYRLARVDRSEFTRSVALDTVPDAGSKPQIPPPIAEPMKKQCTKCGTVKRLTDFSPNKQYKSGINSVCKACVAAYARERYAAKRDLVVDQNKVDEPSSRVQGAETTPSPTVFAPYNVKGFLLPNSIRSCASYHAKILDNGEYLFRIHDCVTGIRLRGDLNDPEQLCEAIDKLEALASACTSFAYHIKQHRNARK